MKKILLIIGITLLIFQMIVLAVDIDMGSPAINRASYGGGGVTYIQKNNPANDSGKITQVEIYPDSAMTGCEVATFYVVSGNNLSTRDTHNIGNVSTGHQTFSGLDITVEAGDYLGIYFVTGRIDLDAGGAPDWYLSGDNIPTTDTTFSVRGYGITMSLYGTGATEEEEEEANAIFFGTNF